MLTTTNKAHKSRTLLLHRNISQSGGPTLRFRHKGPLDPTSEIMLLRSTWLELGSPQDIKVTVKAVNAWMADEGERCQVCGDFYTDVYRLPDEWWELVTPKPEHPDAGLLCPPCALSRLTAQETSRIDPIGWLWWWNDTPHKRNFTADDKRSVSGLGKTCVPVYTIDPLPALEPKP